MSELHQLHLVFIRNQGAAYSEVYRCCVLSIVFGKLGKSFIHILNVLLIGFNLLPIGSKLYLIRADLLSIRLNAAAVARNASLIRLDSLLCGS